MPQRIRRMDQIMDREKRDMFFIRFGGPFDRESRHPSRRRHFEWFAANGLRHELAVPRGYVLGHPDVHAVYFDGPDDPRVALYTAAFEDATGKSLDPDNYLDNYRMGLLSYQSWLDGKRSDGGDDEPDRDD